MPDPIEMTIDGDTVAVPVGTTVAAAVLSRGANVFRRSINDMPRGPLCAMGICFECRVTIDGRPHERSCQRLCRPGMEIVTGERAAGTRANETSQVEAADAPLPREQTCDVLIVGAGPAGLHAATGAPRDGARVTIVDDNPAAGGQIWRGGDAGNAAVVFNDLRNLVDAGQVRWCGGTQVVAQPGPGTLLIEQNGSCGTIHYGKLILATGARERFLPFPGWTLPGVVGAGGMQALVKSGVSVAGERVVVAGSGPLLLAVGAFLKRQGAIVPVVAEQAPQRSLVRFAAALAVRHPSKLLQAIGLRRALGATRYRTGCWPVAAEGTDRLEAVVLTDGRRTWREPCQWLACGFGLVPNTELAAHLGCRLVGDRVQVDRFQQTSVPGVFCAGEACGIGGVETAVVEGQIAALAADGRFDEYPALLAARDRARRFAALLDETFALRPELAKLAQADTLVCRCEDVTFGRLRACDDWTEAKLHTRCGMGPCQGRVCGPAAEFLFGWRFSSVRPPVLPTRLDHLACELAPAKRQSADGAL